LLIYNKLTEIFADFRHFWRKVILLIFSCLHYKSSTKTAYRQHAGGKGYFLIVNKKLRQTAARAAVHVVNIKPSTFNYHLFLYGGHAVLKPPSTAAKRCLQTSSNALKSACFGRRTARFGGFHAADGTLCCKYINVRNSRYLGLSEKKPSIVRRAVLTR